MPTFAQLKSKISRKLIDPNNTAISAANVGDAINDAIRYWRYTRFWFNEKTAVLTMNVNDTYVLKDYDPSMPNTPYLPTDFLYLVPKNGFVINYNNLSYTIHPRPPQIFDAQNVRGIGLPYIYTRRSNNYEFYFFPNIAYQLYVYYIKNYDDLVDDSDNNDFTNEADQLIIYEALSRLSGEDRQDLEMNNTYAAKADREADNLLKRTSLMTGSGELTVDTIL